MQILYLSNRPAANTQAGTITEYLDALSKYSEHDVFEISMLHYFPARVDLTRFDAIITHYSLSLGPYLEHYFGKRLIEQLKAFRGLKAAFLQDEYRDIHTYWKNLNELGFDLLFTCIPENEINKVYPKEELPNLRTVNVLTGYVSEQLIKHSTPSITERSVDVGYRARKVPYWLGDLGHEKWAIVNDFKQHTKNTDLTLDLSYLEEDRIYGNAWLEFISSCRTMLGVESGASIVDFDGRLEKQVDSYLAANPSCSYNKVHDLFLKTYEGNVSLNQISPRCFEAAALKTPMVLFEGEYSDILVPNKHYIPLKKDFSNIDSVVDKIKSHSYLQDLADRTYEEIALAPAYSYKAFIYKIDQVLNEEVTKRKTAATSKCYAKAEFSRDLSLSFIYTLNRKTALILQSAILGPKLPRRLVYGLWLKLPPRARVLLRPVSRLFSR